LREEGFGIGHLEVGGLLLANKLSDLAILDQHSITVRSLTKTSNGQIKILANKGGKGGIPVTEKLNLGWVNLHSLAPSLKNGVIVHGDNVNLVDALLLELGLEVVVSRNVVGSTNAGEGANNGYDDRLLALEKIRYFVYASVGASAVLNDVVRLCEKYATNISPGK
jgi:hypothetical protein